MEINYFIFMLTVIYNILQNSIANTKKARAFRQPVKKALENTSEEATTNKCIIAVAKRRYKSEKEIYLGLRDSIFKYDHAKSKRLSLSHSKVLPKYKKLVQSRRNKKRWFKDLISCLSRSRMAKLSSRSNINNLLSSVKNFKDTELSTHGDIKFARKPSTNRAADICAIHATGGNYTSLTDIHERMTEEEWNRRDPELGLSWMGHFLWCILDLIHFNERIPYV